MRLSGFGLQIVAFHGDSEVLGASYTMEQAFARIDALRRPRPDLTALKPADPALTSIVTAPPVLETRVGVGRYPQFDLVACAPIRAKMVSAKGRGHTMQEQTESIESPDRHGLVFRALRPEDLRQAWALSHAANWPHRLEDWQFIYPLGKGVAALDGDQLIGVAMYWDFVSCATFGMIIVSESYRGRRIGSRLVADMLNAVSAPAVLLHATPHGAGVYARQGFQVVGQISQHQGVAVDRQHETLPAGWALRPTVQGDLDVLSELDQRASGLSRQPLMQALLNAGQGIVLEENGRIIGFSMARPFGRGDSIGPVVAVDEKAARVLIAHWLVVYAGRFVRIDIPPESGIAGWLATAGLVRVDNGARMFYGSPPETDGQLHTYALASQALS